ncbi:MAG: hypothetical protein Ct9H300mP16_17440 [Pseudomonadota bacterium]|nr:MAG: hypothetical protein Ct9H300mP16_17440 [Pseudomonadota bacterium]
MKAVKPAAGLVYCFADVIRRKMPIESLLILERVVPLCVRHGAGIEPAVNNLGDAVVAAPVVRMCEDDPIYSRSVQVQVLQGCPQRDSSSAREPTQMKSPSPSVQTGRGVPQKRSRKAPSLYCALASCRTSLANRTRGPS